VVLVLDHFFILTAPGAPAAERLRDWGLREGPRNDHPGQGTSNRRFFFANAMLELLWVRDAEEAAAGSSHDLQFVQRSTEPHASPFGLIFRQAEEGDQAMPFPGWRYQPGYFDDSRFFHVAANSTLLNEPLCIHWPFAAPPTHEIQRSARHVLEVNTHVACEGLSNVLQNLNGVTGLTLSTARQHLLEITLDGDAGAGSLDLRPELALIVHGR
jgi:hypothetical protein